MAEITPLTMEDFGEPDKKEIGKAPSILTNDDFDPPENDAFLSEDEKINFNTDTIFQIQEKSNLSTIPFVDDVQDPIESDKIETVRPFLFGWYNNRSRLKTFQAHIFSWADRAADNLINLSGGNSKQWEYEYIYGSDFARQNKLLSNTDFNSLNASLKEKEEFKSSVDFDVFNKYIAQRQGKIEGFTPVENVLSENPTKKELADLFLNRAFNPLSADLGSVIWNKKYRYETLVGLDSYIDLMRERADELKPNNFKPDYFGRFQPEGVWEKTMAGFGQAPGDLLILGGSTLLTRSPVYGFALVSAIESSDESVGRVAYNTVKGGIEGYIIGAIAHQPTWARRVSMFGLYGSGNAWWHDGQFDDIVSSGIVMGTFGFIPPGRGTDTAGLTDKSKRVNEKGETISVDPKAKDVNVDSVPIVEVNGAERITLDILKLDAHSKPIKDFVNNKENSGYNREVESQIKEPDPIALNIKDKKLDDMSHLDNLIIIKGKDGTEAAIRKGKDYIPFEVIKEDTKPEYRDPMFEIKDTKDGRMESVEAPPPVKIRVLVPRETVIKDGKFLDTYLSLDGTGKVLKVADITVRSDSFNPRGNRWAIENAETTAKRIKEKEKELELEKAREEILDAQGKPKVKKKKVKDTEPEVKILDPLGETGLEKFQTVAFADAYGLKLGGDGSVIIKYSDLIRLKNKKEAGESLNKKDNKWIPNAIKDAQVIIEKRNADLDTRVTNYNNLLNNARTGLNDHLTSLINARPTLGDTNIRRHEHLEASIYENVNVKEPTTKTGSDGRPVETDITPEAAPGKIGMFNSMLKKGLTFVEMMALAPKFIGDQKRNSIMNFGITRTDHIMFREVRALIDKILYRSEILYDPKAINNAKYIVQEGTIIKMPFIIRTMQNALGKIVPVRGKTGALTLFEQMFRSGKEGIKQAKQIVDSIRERSFIKEAEARANVKGNKTKEKVNKEYLKRNEDGTFKYQMSYAEMQSRFGLSDLQIQIIKAMDIGLANILTLYNQNVRKYKDQNNVLIVERPNYDIRSWLGNERAFITALKDIPELGIRKGDLVAALPGSNKKNLKKFVDFFMKENPIYADKKNFKIDYVTKRQQLTKNNVQMLDVFQEIHKFAELTNPSAMGAIKAAEIAFAKRNKSFSPMLERKGIRGFAGEKPGREGATDYHRAYLNYIEGGVRAIKMMQWKDKVEPILYNKNFQRDFPQQLKVTRQWIDNALGRNPGAFATLVENAMISLGNKFRGNADFIPWLVRVGNKFTLYKNLLFFNVRFMNAQIVQPIQVLMPALADMKANFNIRGDIGYALLNGSYLTFRPTKEFRELIVESANVKNKVLDDKYLREFGVDPTGGRDLLTRTEDMARLAADIATGKNLTGILERHSRLQALATFYSYLKSAKYDKTHGKKKMFEQAMRQTDNLMVEYDARHRAIMYGNQGLGGTLGNFFGLFKTFQHNYFGKTARYIRTARENGIKGIEPLVGHFTMQVMTAGLFGIMAIEQVDALIEYINAGRAKFLKETDKLPSLSEIILTSSELSIGEKFGAPSMVAGFDISSTLQAPGLSLNDIFSMPTGAYLFGWRDNRHHGVVGEFFGHTFPKILNGTFNDIDMYRFLKITLPPVLQGPLDQHFANMPWREYPEAFGLVDPNKTVHYTKDHATFYVKDKDRYVVRDPFKEMAGKLRRDASDFMAVWFSGKSFEESLITRALWSQKKISSHIRDVKTAHVIGGAISLVNGDQPTLMYHIFALMEMNYSQDAAFKMIERRILNMDDTAMNRIKALSKEYNMDTADFINTVIHNNGLSGDIMPGFRYGTMSK